MSGYYSFFVHDPKERKIHALHYVDRVVQHCVCDEVLAPTLDRKLTRVFTDRDVLNLLYQIIDSFEVTPGKGLPMGNQTRQWFAIYYLDGFDRLIKEEMRIKHYSRYMDDCVLIHPDKEYLKECLFQMTEYVRDELEDIKQVLSSYRAHLSYGHTYKLQKRIISGFEL